MKNERPSLLILVTCLFAAALLGLFLWKNADRAPVFIRTLPSPTALGTESTAAEETVRPIININTATAQELESLPNIGPMLAQRIVDYRNTHGPFQKVSELASVSGIGEKTLEELWDLVTTGG